MLLFKSFKLGAIASVVALLVACGGGGDAPPAGGGGGGGAPVTGSETGVLSDAVVGGVRYVTSSGVTGTTDAQGHYNYNPGDTVTFSIGSVTLGQVTATGVVTPIHLAGGSEVKLDNLLVLLQSLDSDGNASNGISIAEASANAFTASIDLSQALSADARTAVEKAMTAGGVSGPMKTTEEAENHFKEQSLALLASNVWVIYDETGKPAVGIRMAADGTYIMGETSPADSSGGPGVEAGKASVPLVDANGFKVAASIKKDTNGEWGLSDPQNDERFTVNGDTLTVKDSQDVSTLVKMDNDPAGIVGAWAPEGAPADHALYLFFKNGYFMIVDSVGETADPSITDPCSAGGMELGKYTWDKTTALLVGSNAEMNTNGCTGLFEDPIGTHPTQHKWTVSADGKTAVWAGTDSEEPWEVKMVRVSK